MNGLKKHKIKSDILEFTIEYRTWTAWIKRNLMQRCRNYALIDCSINYYKLSGIISFGCKSFWGNYLRTAIEVIIWLLLLWSYCFQYRQFFGCWRSSNTSRFQWVEIPSLKCAFSAILFQLKCLMFKSRLVSVIFIQDLWSMFKFLFEIA